MTKRRSLTCWAQLAIALTCSAASGCREADSGDVVTLRLRGTTQPLAAAAIRYEPAADVVSARLGAQGWLVLERRSRARPLTVRIPELCPVTIPPGAHAKPIETRPVIDLGSERPPLGFDAAFAITARHGCAERGRGQIRWRQLEGAPLEALAVSPDGFQLTARTQRLESAHPEPFSAGIVPFSPRTQGRVVLEASWQGPGLPPVKRTVTVRATSRSNGLSSVAVSQQLLLSGAGFRVESAPAGARAQVHARGALSQLTPDAPGRWVLADASGQTLSLQALVHDATPYDCGRSECHAAIASAAAASPMSHALQAPLDAAQPAVVPCSLECHVVGERGSDDGGFLDVADELGFTWLASSRFSDLPRTLRRLGGVRCTACHGPGAIPEPTGREQILQSDVCATCHDAPPRYTRVQQWRASRMARSDATERTREPGCAVCHTTAGFLDAIGARPTRAAEKSNHQPAGIACAACHAPHAADSGPRLIRRVAGSDPRLPPSTALCVRCHSPVEGELVPAAASFVLWSGSARVPAHARDGWEPLTALSAHRAVPGGCVGCHGASPLPGGKLDHSFRVEPRSCASCHGDGGQPARGEATQGNLRRRAEDLARRLAPACPPLPTAPPHASAVEPCSSRPLTRARYEIALVLEDAAAAIHNAPLAKALLDDAERELSE